METKDFYEVSLYKNIMKVNNICTIQESCEQLDTSAIKNMLMLKKR